MSIKSDRWITKMSKAHGMIEPFADRQVRDGVISYGVSSYGYDMRVAPEFKIFTNVLSAVVDPKQFDPKSFVEFKGDVCIVPPNSFALASSIEYFRIPRNCLTVCVGKSTYARGSTRMRGLRRCCSLRQMKGMSAKSRTRIKRANIRRSGALPFPSCKAPLLSDGVLSDSCLLVVGVGDGERYERQHKEAAHPIQRLQRRQVVQHNLQRGERRDPQTR